VRPAGRLLKTTWVDSFCALNFIYISSQQLVAVLNTEAGVMTKTSNSLHRRCQHNSACKIASAVHLYLMTEWHEVRVWVYPVNCNGRYLARLLCSHDHCPFKRRMHLRAVSLQANLPACVFQGPSGIAALKQVR